MNALLLNQLEVAEAYFSRIKFLQDRIEKNKGIIRANYYLMSKKAEYNKPDKKMTIFWVIAIWLLITVLPIGIVAIIIVKRKSKELENTAKDKYEAELIYYNSKEYRDYCDSLSTDNESAEAQINLDETELNNLLAQKDERLGNLKDSFKGYTEPYYILEAINGYIHYVKTNQAQTLNEAKRLYGLELQEIEQMKERREEQREEQKYREKVVDSLDSIKDEQESFHSKINDEINRYHYWNS